MLHQNLEDNIRNYVNQPEFQDALQVRGAVNVQFLAQGEYNMNYILSARDRKFVFRVNTGSQMNLDNQIGYEYQALDLLRDSGVTPLPLYLDAERTDIPYGCLVMEYLPGEPLNYARDLMKASQTFAKIHSLSFPKGKTDFLIQVNGPFSVIYDEVGNLLRTYMECPRGNLKTKKLLEKVFLVSGDKVKDEKYFGNQSWRAVLNTEVNSHNFIVNDEQGACHLIDWEKPIYGEPAQDLSMFLIRTTTLWKRNVILSVEQEELFLESYLKSYQAFLLRQSFQDLYDTSLEPTCFDRASPEKHEQYYFGLGSNFEDLAPTLRERVEMFKFFNLLRAISWCAMAWTEYTQPGRPLVNEDTFAKIQMYLDEEFIKGSFPAVF
ncbi:aminoglycoside phosphotransferase family protein [Desulfitobacterium sp. THU1]|uniref:aminoglycoside phosphotransferase family protein n=1 Tax=Desulfitobacterium sp. THU1 TaxID=3138072 RepID=UPI00311E97E7